METTIKYPEVIVRLTGNDGNAFAIMGAVRKALKTAKVSAEEIAEYTEQSTMGDYDNLLRVAMAWVTVK
jgi:hypothetical protein